MDARPYRSHRARTPRAIPVLLLILATVLAACAGPPRRHRPPQSPRPIGPRDADADRRPGLSAVIVDDEGTSVTIPAEPQRIVTLTPAATETLFALGVGDRIVGKSEDILLYPPEAGAIPDVEKFDGSAIAVDIEKIVAAKADLVIAGGNFGTPPDAVQRLRELGLPVVVVYAPSVATVLDDIALLGTAVGRSDEAAAIAQRMSEGFAAVETAVAGETRPRVYYEIDATGAFYGPADESFLRRDDLDGRRRPGHDRFAGQVRHLRGAPAPGRSRGHPPRRCRLRRHRRRRGGATRLVDDDGGEDRRHPADRRHDDHAAGSAPVPRPAAPRVDDPPGRGHALPVAGASGPVTFGAATFGDTGSRLDAAARARDRRLWLVVGGIVVGVAGALLGIALGSVPIPFGDTVAIIVDRLLGTHLSGADPATVAIVWDLRVPRVLTAMVVGTGLAVAGATFQGLLRNPLADPYVLGTASGAALGAAIAVLIPIRTLVLGFGLVHVLAFVGALIAVTTCTSCRASAAWRR